MTMDADIAGHSGSEICLQQ